MAAVATGELLATTGEIARREGVQIHRVNYVIRREHIPPTQRAGGLRLYDRAAVERIRHALRTVPVRVYG